MITVVGNKYQRLDLQNMLEEPLNGWCFVRLVEDNKRAFKLRFRSVFKIFDVGWNNLSVCNEVSLKIQMLRFKSRNVGTLFCVISINKPVRRSCTRSSWFGQIQRLGTLEAVSLFLCHKQEQRHPNKPRKRFRVFWWNTREKKNKSEKRPWHLTGRSIKSVRCFISGGASPCPLTAYQWPMKIFKSIDTRTW